MALKHKARDVERAFVVHPSTPAVRTENEYEPQRAAALERIVAKHPSALRPADILTLQRTVGNRGVQRLLSHQPHSLSSPPSTTSYAIQRKTKEEEPLQGKFETSPQRENRTGLPDRLKAGIENLSSLSLDDVRVHRNSSRPAELQALAYTQGTDIHLGPNEEQHLPHEAWHVVQQKQGRVKPRLQAKGAGINDEEGLEKEADVMGAWAKYRGNESLQRHGISGAQEIATQRGRNVGNEPVIQLEKKTPVYTGDGHATKVTFSLVKDDTLDAGSQPNANVSGWQALRTLGLTDKKADNVHNWVQFHVLNAKSGGSGREAKNLTPTTTKANHQQEWNDFEKAVKLYIDYERPVIVTSVEFEVDIDYHDAEKVYWKGEENRTLETDSEDYPSNVYAKITATWDDVWDAEKETTANLDESDGLIRPQDLQSVRGWRAYSDEEHEDEIEGEVR